MKHVILALALIMLSTASLAAQWTGMPAWNDPKGGTGLMIAGDWGHPGTDAGKGNAFGVRGSLGLGTLTLTGGVASYKPAGYSASTTGYGGQAAIRLIGGSLIPLAVDLQLGAGRSASIAGTVNYPQVTTVIGAIGISVPLPTPGFSIEPFFSPGIRYHRYSDLGTGIPDQDQTKFGFTVGGNLGFGLLGIHLAYDYQKTDAGHQGVFGLGAHMAFRPTLGL